MESLLEIYKDQMNRNLSSKKNMTISEWQKAVYDNAVKKGWNNRTRPVPEMLCLIHSEISEALEAYRSSNTKLFNEECADIAIRLIDMCSFLNIDLEKEMLIKHEKNKLRPYRHGNKKC